MRAAAARLLVLLLAAAGTAAQQRRGEPDRDVFAWRELTTKADGALEIQNANTCLSGHAVAGLWVVFSRTKWENLVYNVWTNEPAHIAFIRIYSHEKDPATGAPKYIDIGSGDASDFSSPEGRREGTWIALQPFEAIKRITLTSNGFPGDAERLGAIKIETSAQTLEVSSALDPDLRNYNCINYDYKTKQPAAGCPVAIADRRSVVTDDADGLLGSGTLCGFYGTVARSSNKYPGIKEITPVMLNWVVRSNIKDVQYQPGWQDALGPLQPQVAAAVRIDNRAGRQASVTVKLTDTTVDTATTSFTAGASLAYENSVTVGLEVPSGVFKKTGSDFTVGGSWDKGTLETKGTVREVATAAGSTVKTAVGAGKWTQIVFANYKSAYDVAYTGNMTMTIENRRFGQPYRTTTLSFETRGRVQGASTSATSYTLCDLDATGNCPALPPNNTLPPPPDPTVGVPLISSLSNAEVLSAFFVSTPPRGAPGSGGTPFGFRYCLDGQRYLARIEAVNVGTDWASSLRLWYSTGTPGDPAVAVNIGRVDANAQVTSTCSFGRNDKVISATTWNNNGRDNVCRSWSGGDPTDRCRWGKTEFKIVRGSGKVETCAIQIKNLYGEYFAGFTGPSPLENIGSGRLCGAVARAGADVDAVGWIFMRDATALKTNVETTTSAGELTPPGFDTTTSTAVDNRGHDYTVEAAITPFTLTQTVKQTWETTASEAFAEKKSFTVTSMLFEIQKTSYKYGQSYTTSTKTVTGGTLSKSTSSDVSFTVEVPPNNCTLLQTRQYKNTADFVSWSGRAALTFDNGRSVALPVSGSLTFGTANVYEIIPSSCNDPVRDRPLLGQGRRPVIRPAQMPSSLVVAAAFKKRSDDVLRDLARQYRLPLYQLRAWNARLPRQLAKGVKYTIHLAPPPRQPGTGKPQYRRYGG